MSLLSQLFGGGINMPTFPNDPAAGYDITNLQGRLKQLYDQIDLETAQQMKEQMPALLDIYQRRGIGGSGIEQSAVSRFVRDLDAQNLSSKYGQTFNMAQLMNNEIQGLRDWTLAGYNAALGQQQSKQDRNNQILGGLVNLGSAAAGGAFRTTGAGGGATSDTVSGSALPNFTSGWQNMANNVYGGTNPYSLSGASSFEFRPAYKRKPAITRSGAINRLYGQG